MVGNTGPVVRLTLFPPKKKNPSGFSTEGIFKSGTLEGIRTPDPLIRSQVLYPAELRVRWQTGCGRAKKHLKASAVKNINRIFRPFAKRSEKITGGYRAGKPAPRSKPSALP
jgi:hypothetical protein